MNILNYFWLFYSIFCLFSASAYRARFYQFYALRLACFFLKACFKFYAVPVYALVYFSDKYSGLHEQSIIVCFIQDVRSMFDNIGKNLRIDQCNRQCLVKSIIVPVDFCKR